jgi:hypothetical protein
VWFIPVLWVGCMISSRQMGELCDSSPSDGWVVWLVPVRWVSCVIRPRQMGEFNHLTGTNQATHPSDGDESHNSTIWRGRITQLNHLTRTTDGRVVWFVPVRWVSCVILPARQVDIPFFGVFVKKLGIIYITVAHFKWYVWLYIICCAHRLLW